MFSEDIIANGLAHMIASDAHHIPGRKYNMRAAFDKLTKQYGQSMVNEFDNNARALVNH